ncbi:hypothetical protein DPV78_001765 [Talaromyces pinophilus]|nr:hypothetical protein DPV78_001765 [Talaromyces pinophilus]
MNPLRTASNLSPAIRQAPRNYLFTSYSNPKPLNKPNRTRQLDHAAFYSTKTNKPNNKPKQQPDQESLFDRLYLQWQESDLRQMLDELRIRKNREYNDWYGERTTGAKNKQSDGSKPHFIEENIGFMKFISDVIWYPTLVYLVWKNMPSEEELRRMRDKKAGKGGDGESDGSREGEGGQEMWFNSGDGEEQQEGAGSRDRDWYGFGDKDTVLTLTGRSTLN